MDNIFNWLFGGGSGIQPTNSNIQNNNQVQSFQPTTPAPSAQLAPTNYYSGGSSSGGSITPQAASTAPKVTSPTGGGGGGGGGGGSTQQNNQPSAPAQPSWEDQMRGVINDKWNGYFGELDNMFNGLNDSASAQNGIVDNTYKQGVSDLDATQSQNQNIINNQRDRTESNRTRNLNDISDNITNLMNAGNVFLGSRGAGDSSAANQYAYALTKLGTKERGNVNMNTDNLLGDINMRETNLRTTYTQAVKQLDTEKQNKMLDVARWLADAQNQIRGMKANGQLGKGQDLQQLSTNVLNYAMQEIARVNQENSSQRQALEQWALNTSTTISQVKDKMGAIGNVAINMPQANAINGMPTVNSSGNFSAAPVGFGSTTDQKDQNLFGVV
jgi:hypothetical protein